MSSKARSTTQGVFVATYFPSSSSLGFARRSTARSRAGAATFGGRLQRRTGSPDRPSSAWTT